MDLLASTHLKHEPRCQRIAKGIRSQKRLGENSRKPQAVRWQTADANIYVLESLHQNTGQRSALRLPRECATQPNARESPHLSAAGLRVLRNALVLVQVVGD